MSSPTQYHGQEAGPKNQVNEKVNQGQSLEASDGGVHGVDGGDAEENEAQTKPGGMGGEGSAAEIGVMGSSKSGSTRALFLGVLAVLAIVYTLYCGRVFLMPVAIAVLLNFLLQPFTRMMHQRFRFPYPLAAGVIALVFGGAVVAGGYGLSYPLLDWVEQAPQSLNRIQSKFAGEAGAGVFGKVQRLLDRIEDMTRMPVEDGQAASPSTGGGADQGGTDGRGQAGADAGTAKAGKVGAGGGTSELAQTAKRALVGDTAPTAGGESQGADGSRVSDGPQASNAGTANAASTNPESGGGGKSSDSLAAASSNPVSVRESGSTLSSAIMGYLTSIGKAALTAGVLTFFLLASGDTFLRKLMHVLPNVQDKKKAAMISHQVEHHISTFLVTYTAINICLGLATAGVMWLIGMPNPLLWGAIAAVFNFVPYLGPVGVMVILMVVGLLQFDSVSHALVAPASFFCLNLCEAYAATPALLGKRLSLHPVAVLLSITFWFFLWGVTGAIMAVPLLVAFKIMCDHIEPLKPISEFFSGATTQRPSESAQATQEPDKHPSPQPSVKPAGE